MSAVILESDMLDRQGEGHGPMFVVNMADRMYVHRVSLTDHVGVGNIFDNPVPSGFALEDPSVMVLESVFQSTLVTIPPELR